MENTNYRWVKENPPKGKQNADPGKVKKAALFAIAAVFAALLVFTSFYTVDDKQQAVVTTFGKVSDITQPGLHFKIPFGIQQVHKVDVNVYQKIELGYITDEEGHAITKTNESAMITGDYNIVNVDFFVEYKISDPVKYLYASESPKEVLRNLIQSQVRNVVGSSTVDATLTDGKAEMQLSSWPDVPAMAQGLQLSDLDKENETLLLTNTGSQTIDLTGCYLSSTQGNEIFVLPAGTLIAPGQALTISTLTTDGKGDILWPEKKVWSNDKPDAAVLCDVFGRLLATTD